MNFSDWISVVIALGSLVIAIWVSGWRVRGDMAKEYAPLKALRQQHMRFDVVLVDGLSDDEVAANLRRIGGPDVG